MVALFYNAAIPRYHFLTWFLTMLVVMVWFHQVGIGWLKRRYPVMSDRIRRPSLVAAACIRPDAAAESIRMSKQPIGIANGLTNYGDRDFSLYLRRSFAKSMGYSSDHAGKAGGRHRLYAVRLQQLPPPFPRTARCGETRRAGGRRAADRISHHLARRGVPQSDQPEIPQSDVDGHRGNGARAADGRSVVLMGGCDKTVPAQLMGAVSAGRPAVMLVGGPMMTGRHRGERLGACTDCRRFWAQYRAGKIDDEEINEVEGKLATTAGTCAVMGTASTMACLAEALGMILPGTAAIPGRACRPPARGGSHRRRGGEADRLQLTPDKIVNQKSIENALRVLLAIGGSTNAIIHLTAIAGRAGIPVSLQRLNELSDTTPVLVNLKPVGNGYMEDFFAAGGMGALMRELKDLLHLDAMTVTGETLGERLTDRRRLGRPHHHRRTQQAAGAARRAGGAVRQSGAAGRDPQALGRRLQSVRARGQGGGVLPRWPISPRASTIPSSTSKPTIFWCCKMPARIRSRRCRRPVICRFRKNSRPKASRTWCECRTRA